MGENTREALKLQFDRRLRLEFHSARITSDAGLVACGERDGALGLTEAAPTCLRETRGGRNVQHELVLLLRQSVYGRLAGYEDTNDARIPPCKLWSAAAPWRSRRPAPTP